MKWVVVIVTIIVVGALGVAYHLKTNYPKSDPPYNIRVTGTPEQIARGRYLANHVTVCLECHSTRDWAHFSAPPIPGTEGKGGEVFPETAGFPGTLIAPNITPAALGDWTDGEIIRAFTSGVNKNGDPLFPLMPYRAYRNLMPADIESIVAYVRTLAPIDHIPPRSKLNFPLNLIVRTMPEPYKLPNRLIVQTPLLMASIWRPLPDVPLVIRLMIKHRGSLLKTCNSPEDFTFDCPAAKPCNRPILHPT